MEIQNEQGKIRSKFKPLLGRHFSDNTVLSVLGGFLIFFSGFSHRPIITE